MSAVWNLPLFMIVPSLFCGALCLLLPKKAAYGAVVTLLSVLTVFDLIVLRYTAENNSFTYSMGEFPAPWGNEIRAGVLECVVLFIFLVVILCSVIAGYRYLQMHIEESKHNLFCSLLSLSTAAVVSLVFTNDIFTGYVFLEILTLASCGLLVVKQTGKTTLAGVRYMVLNLFGSGLFLLGVVMLYGFSGHLLMVPLRETISVLTLDPQTLPSLVFAIGVLTIGLAIKSGLFPFHSWMPDTYGWATPTTASLMSSVVSKAYIFLLIKVYWRVIGIDLFEQMPIGQILFFLGIAGAIIGSVYAIKATDLNRMVAYSSAAQIGYIFMSLGIGGTAGYAAAIFHLIGHSLTKSLLFLVTPRLQEVSGGSLRFKDLMGSAQRDRVSGFLFLFASLSMVGFPALAGFSSKLLITEAAFDSGNTATLILVVLTLAVSTVLNALYFIRTVLRIYARTPGKKDRPVRGMHTPGYLIPAFVLVGLNLFLGLLPTITSGLIWQGFSMLP
ncbi:MAG: sodium:proton antiporter [Eubacterium sp.]|nr:sodium:proton antiporter [Eubacterium sp.]